VTPSFYFGFSNAQLQVIVPWLQLNSLGLTILIHPNTDDPRATICITRCGSTARSR
jgi:DOPA 4,5-dioxygenase